MTLLRLLPLAALFLSLRVSGAPYRPTEAARDRAVSRLATAGLPGMLREQGLILWQVTPYTSRSGEKIMLSVSLPLGGRPFEPGEGGDGRRVELQRRLSAAESRLIAEVARVLEMPADMVSFDARLIEGCCGAGCQSCLLTKPEHSKLWTGLKPRPSRENGH